MDFFVLLLENLGLGFFSILLALNQNYFFVFVLKQNESDRSARALHFILEKNI